MKTSRFPWWLLLIVLLVAVGVGITYLGERQKTVEQTPIPTPPPVIEVELPPVSEPELDIAEEEIIAAAPEVQAGPEQSAEAEIVEAPEPFFSFELPPLMESDKKLLEVIAKKMGPEWTALLVDEAIIERAVAVVDNLTRHELNPRQLPLKLPSGQYRVIEADGVLYPSNANIARYKPYIDLLQVWQPEQWLAFYQHVYPLLQEAHAQLGYPDSPFHDKLLSVVDSLLAAPKAPTAPKLEQPNVFYQYADKTLERRSEADRFMMRLGPTSQHELKVWLQQIRIQLLTWQP